MKFKQFIPTGSFETNGESIPNEVMKYIESAKYHNLDKLEIEDSIYKHFGIKLFLNEDKFNNIPSQKTNLTNLFYWGIEDFQGAITSEDLIFIIKNVPVLEEVDNYISYNQLFRKQHGGLMEL